MNEFMHILRRKRRIKKKEINNVIYSIERIYERRLIYFANDNDSVEIFRTHAHTNVQKSEEGSNEI